MDFKYLVQSGEYSRDDLTETQNAYIDGTDAAVDDAYNLLEMIKSDIGENPRVLDQIKLEIIEDFVNELAEWIDGSTCQYIVEQSDNNMEQNEQQMHYDEPMRSTPPMDEQPPQQPQRYGSRANRPQQQQVPQQPEPRYNQRGNNRRY